MEKLPETGKLILPTVNQDRFETDELNKLLVTNLIPNQEVIARIIAPSPTPNKYAHDHLCRVISLEEMQFFAEPWQRIRVVTLLKKKEMLIAFLVKPTSRIVDKESHRFCGYFASASFDNWDAEKLLSAAEEYSWAN